MALHHRHTRTVTVTVPTLDVRRALSRCRSVARSFERTCARHWPMAAYGALTIATAAYVVVQLVTIT